MLVYILGVVGEGMRVVAPQALCRGLGVRSLRSTRWLSASQSHITQHVCDHLLYYSQLGKALTFSTA